MLDKIAYLQSKMQPKATPEDAPRLFDLVRVKDQSVVPAFYYALRDTLVAEDIEQASRIAYGKTRYRVVTLEGSLIDISGTMTGGGRVARSGGMRASIVRQFTNGTSSCCELR